ncbi:uncharacterized protein LOC101454586 [Ceratitis capitata]|uniref:uncharacterized protein LOC101454586 n=1 Tax=Ceratitis capitata TaxID=7213 RepID=UPI00032A1798|nr:uncharacterized protein LOC101454586 [Ceratitis capitata]
MSQSIVQAEVSNLFSTLKRKRQNEEHIEPSAEVNACFTNSAFSSTPKKIIARRRTPIVAKSDVMQNACMEVKSISEIAKSTLEKKIITDAQVQNPYEVQRKPPKKKKRETEIIEACFENPALNLEVPEKQFNPYEVLRDVPTKVNKSNCFVNAALNLRIEDMSTTRNPFEIQRYPNVPETSEEAGVENPGLEDAQATSTELKISLPFKPTLGCRIDFSNIPIEQLTPGKLLAEKLIFSPVLQQPKRSLDSASEDSSMDIGKELDRYQLELENSINEAKMRKAIEPWLETKSTELIKLNINVEQKITFNQRLEEIAEEDEEKENEDTPELLLETSTVNECTKVSCITLTGKLPVQRVESELNKVEEIKHEDVAYASDSEEEDVDFKTPAPFVRAYHRPVASHFTAGSKESLHSNSSNDSNSDNKKSSSVRNIIRKSLRKLMHPHKEDDTSDKETHLLGNDAEVKKNQYHSAYKIIRNSLRRKTPKTTQLEESTTKAEISIIDTTERTMKLRAELLPNEGMERKHTLRNSLRRSTREIGQHLMKTVFHKNQEAYELGK